VSVADEWQKKGLGTTLLHNLRVQAFKARLRLMYGEMLAMNRAALALAKLFRFAIAFNPEDARTYLISANLNKIQEPNPGQMSVFR
jgi:hypothetical protein